MSEILKQIFLGGIGPQRCPACDELITTDVINIKEGVALCSGCGKLSRLSELNLSGRSLADILAHPPARCSIVSDGHRVTATVSMRSLAGFLFPAAFALFWNSITSVFVLIAIAGLYSNLIGPLPNWFPAPGLNDGKPEMNGEPMDLGMTLFLCVFLIPFVVVGVGMAATALMNFFGRVEVVIDEYDSYVSTGFWFFRWKKRFDPREVLDVKFGGTAWRTEGGANKLIEIVAERPVKFGSMLQWDRMEWLRAALRQTLLPRNDDSQDSKSLYLMWLSRRKN